MIYLDNNATTRKKPIGVLYTLLKETILSANAGRGGHTASVRTAKKIEEVRTLIRKNFLDGEVIFTKNCTEALNLGLTAKLPFKRVVTTTLEHNSVLRPLKRMEREGKIKLVIVEPDKEGEVADNVIKSLTPDTGLVVVSGMSNVTGKRQEIEKIAKKVKETTKALMMVDGAQCAGMSMILNHVDLYATSGHKSLHGVQGTGFLVVKRGILLEPLVVGGTGTSGSSVDIPKEMPEGMEAGTLNAPAIIALGKGIEYTFRHAKKIKKKKERWTEMFCKGIEGEAIRVYGAERGTVLCNFDHLSCQEASDILSEQYGICVRSGIHCAPLTHRFLGTLPEGALRISFGINNTDLQVRYAVRSFKKIARKQ